MMVTPDKFWRVNWSFKSDSEESKIRGFWFSNEEQAKIQASKLEQDGNKIHGIDAYVKEQS